MSAGRYKLHIWDNLLTQKKYQRKVYSEKCEFSDLDLIKIN